jgi:hypothetical protein
LDFDGLIIHMHALIVQVKETIVVLASGAILLSGLLLGQTAQAALVESGTAQLADVLEVDTGPESLTVSYSVFLTAGVYTYSYSVANPTGDVILPPAPGAGGPEVVDAFAVAFNTTIGSGTTAAYIPGTQTGGTAMQNNGTSGLFWSFTVVNPGSSSPTLSFQSYLPPVLGNANASDENPPSPWSSSPFGQQVPIPETPVSTPEPPTTALLALTFLLLPFRSNLRRFLRLSGPAQ